MCVCVWVCARMRGRLRWEDEGREWKRESKMCYRHVTAMYDTAWSDGFQEILFDVKIIHVNSVR